MWGTEKLIGKLKDFIAKVKAYFDGLTTNTKAEAALLKEMRDGGLHYLERIVEAYDKAATAAVESYQGAETRSEGGENQYMARGRYWRPQLKRAEWALLERRMNAEIKSSENFLDEATKWVYADEKGVQVFALYGIGDGTDATPLYAVGGKTASAKAKMLMDYIREEQNYDGDRKALDALLKGYGHFEGNGRSNLSNRRGGRTAAGRNAALHGGPSGSDGRRASGRGTENQRGVKDQFSLRDSEGRSLTEAQQDYFKDSKVRDADGNLLVMYHQTNGTFTVFDTKHKGAGAGDDETPFGIFLKRTSRNIGVRGEKQMELYADIRNPLRVRDRTELVSKLRELSVDYARLKDESAQIDKEYKAKFEEAKNAFKSFLIQWRKNNPDAPPRAAYDADGFDAAFNAEDNVVKEWTRAKDELALRAKTSITQALRDNGYDGVILENDKGSWGRSTDAYIALDANQVKNTTNQSPTADPDIRYSIREIKGEDGTDYGKGVYLDSTLLEGLTDAERKEMMRERVKELGGQTITAYDPNGEAVDIRIAAPREKFRNRNGRKVPVTKDLSTKRNGTKVKQESVVLADELIATSRYEGQKKAGYPHDWLDNNGKNDWQYWTTYIQDKNNTVWKATLNVAESANGVKYLYDIDPIEKVGQSVKSDTSTTGDIVAQNQTGSQAQIRSSTLSDRDVLRIAAQMAKNSESMLDIKKNHPASSLFRAYNSVPAASAEWLYWQYNLCWAECQHQGLAFFLRGSVNRFSVNFFSIEVITASPSFFRTIQVCCVDIEIKTDFTAHIRRTRILKYTKSLSIADQFPGFNIISVFFLTEFLCIFFDKYNSIFDDISRIHSDSTPLEHFFSMPCREAATLPDCTCVRTMNFNPCAP